MNVCMYMCVYIYIYIYICIAPGCCRARPRGSALRSCGAGGIKETFKTSNNINIKNPNSTTNSNSNSNSNHST